MQLQTKVGMVVILLVGRHISHLGTIIRSKWLIERKTSLKAVTKGSLLHQKNIVYIYIIYIHIYKHHNTSSKNIKHHKTSLLQHSNLSVNTCPMLRSQRSCRPQVCCQRCQQRFRHRRCQRQRPMRQDGSSHPGRFGPFTEISSWDLWMFTMEK